MYLWYNFLQKSQGDNDAAAAPSFPSLFSFKVLLTAYFLQDFIYWLIHSFIHSCIIHSFIYTLSMYATFVHVPLKTRREHHPGTELGNSQKLPTPGCSDLNLGELLEWVTSTLVPAHSSQGSHFYYINEPGPSFCLWSTFFLACLPSLHHGQVYLENVH